MLNSLRNLCLAALVAVLATVSGGESQRVLADDSHSHAEDSHAGHAHGGRSIAYRRSDWKEMEFDDPGKASQHLAAVQKLGCEAKQASHDGHTDVTYRSPRWQSLEVATDELAHQWEAWLKGAGFETVHGHAGDHADHDHAGHDHGPDGVEEVAFRMVNWKTVHLDDRAKLAEFNALMQGFGCEVKADEHDGHSDISFRCPDWTHAEFASHEAAQGWEDWLKKTGFEVRHSH